MGRIPRPTVKRSSDKRDYHPTTNLYSRPHAVILQPEDEEQRLDVSRTPFAKAKSLLQPYSEDLMDAHDVSTIVNSAKYDGPECIEPILDDEIPPTGQLSLL